MSCPDAFANATGMKTTSVEVAGRIILRQKNSDRFI